MYNLSSKEAVRKRLRILHKCLRIGHRIESHANAVPQNGMNDLREHPRVGVVSTFKLNLT